MKRRLCLLLTALFFIVTGCSAIVNRQYKSVEFHPYVNDSEPLANSVGSYDELVRVLTARVRAAETDVTLTFSRYDGNVESDLAKACYAVSAETPIGVYAVDYMTFDKPDYLGSNARSTVFINYSKTAEAIKAVAYVSVQDFNKTVEQTLTQYATRLTLETGYFNPADARLQDAAWQMYVQSPLWAVDLPQVSVTIYPPNGIHCVVDITFAYSLSTDEIAERVQLSRTILQQMQPEEPDTPGVAAQAVILSRLAQDRIAYDATPIDLGKLTDADTIYGALAERNATSLGLALAYKALCDRWGLTCQLIVGELDGSVAAWNMVQLTDSWYHIDISAALSGREAVQLRGDEAMLGYTWAAEEYPTAANDWPG